MHTLFGSEDRIDVKRAIIDRVVEFQQGGTNMVARSERNLLGRSGPGLFTGRTVVLTGATPDFGETLSIYLAGQGARLYLSARSLAEAEKTASFVRSCVPAAVVDTCKADLCDADSIAAFAAFVADRAGSIDILINNASMWLPGYFADASDEAIAETIGSTVSGSLILVRHLLPLLKASAGADVVNIVARCALAHDRHFTSSEVFSSAKAAMAHGFEVLRSHLRKYGIRVISLYPPNFRNLPILDFKTWMERRESAQYRYLSSRNVLDALIFALRCERSCSISTVELSNSYTELF